MELKGLLHAKTSSGLRRVRGNARFQLRARTERVCLYTCRPYRCR